MEKSREAFSRAAFPSGAIDERIETRGLRETDAQHSLDAMFYKLHRKPNKRYTADAKFSDNANKKNTQQVRLW